MDLGEAAGGPDEFASTVMARLTERGAGGLHYDPEAFAINDDPERPQLILSRASVYSECHRDPDHRDLRIDRPVDAYVSRAAGEVSTPLCPT